MSGFCTQGASGRRAVFAHKGRVVDERRLHTRGEWTGGRVDERCLHIRAMFAHKRRVVDERCLHTRCEW